MEQILFGSSAGRITPLFKASEIKGFIDGTIPMPDTYVIGSNCKRNHGIGDKGVRYIYGGCVMCQSVTKKASNNKSPNSEHDKQHKIAMDKIEEQAMLKELGLEGGLDSDIQVG